MYIAIEGIKGSGKSTLVSRISAKYSQGPSEFSSFPITASMGNAHPLEQLLLVDNELRNNDDFLEMLFLHRAYWNQPKADSKLILGDRSIATAIVSRWDKWGDPYHTIEKVKTEYRNIRTPNVIIWLDTPMTNALENIGKRKQKILGKREEGQEQLSWAKGLYEELLLDGLLARKMAKTQIIKIQNTGDYCTLSEEINSIIKFYKK